MRLMGCMLILLLLLMPKMALADALTATDKVVEGFMGLDGNGSESVSLAEYKSMVLSRMKERFKQMDKNHDGSITAKEYRVFWVKQKSQYYRPRR